MQQDHRPNIDRETVEGFREEWAAFDQSRLASAEYDKLRDGYFSIFPFSILPANLERSLSKDSPGARSKR
jgi:hypothetical protein